MSERIDPRDPGAGVSGGAAAGAAGDDMPAEIVPMSLALTFERLAVVVETWNGAVETWNGAVEGCGPVTASSPGFELRDGFRPSAVALDVERMSDTALLEATRSLFGVNAPVQALLTRVAGEIAHRSRRSLGVEGVAKNAGHPNAASLVAELGAIPFGEAQRLCKVGAATAVQRSLLGGRGEPEYPVLAAAVDDAEVGVAAASHIITNLGQATSRALRQDMDAAEAKLVEFAKTSLPETVRKLAIAWRDALDTDGIAPREEELIARRSLQWKKLANGMEQCIITLDPLGAGFLHAVISARVGDLLRGVHFDEESVPMPPCSVHANKNGLIDCGCPRMVPGESGTETGAEPETGTDHGPCVMASVEDPRTIPQLSYDALVEVLQHILECTESPGTLPHTTLVVRMDLEALTSALGAAHIDGVEQPISARTARILAADAHIIPQVLGGDSAVLDQGVGKRLFTTAQKLALAERDGGCAVTNCPQPPAHTEAHHIDWWARDDGPTDLANGILLCTHDHHMVHRQGGDIRVIDNVPWFIPPPPASTRAGPHAAADGSRHPSSPPPPAPSTASAHDHRESGQT